MDAENRTSGRISLTAGLAAAYLSNNSVQARDLAELIGSIHSALTGLGAPKAEPAAEKPVPAVSIKKSITPDHLISLEDGKRYKTLKRHLSGRGLTPAEYRTKWGLPSDYPMVAASYSANRSEMARSNGLGRKAAAPVPEPAPEPKRRGRPKKAV